MQIMVVDDDGVSRFALIDLMHKMGFSDVLEFPDGLSAWHYLEQNPLPVLCCCDVRMPNMSGLELLEKVRGHAETKELQFVLITSGSERGTVQDAIRMGVDGYIVKPFIAEEAARKFRDTLEKNRKNIAEDPHTTAKRLSISMDKLAAYYDAFKAQVDQFIAAINSSSVGDLDGQIDTMKTGCLTLGLWHCSKELERLSKRDDKLESIISFLLAVNSTVEYQRAVLKA